MRTLTFPIAENTKLYVRGGYATIVILIVSLMLMVSTIWLNGWFFLAGLILLSICCAINSMVVVEAKDTAYASVLGNEPKHSIMNGLRWVIPFITEVVNIETRPTVYEFTESNINMPKGITITVKYTIAYHLVAENVYKFARQWFKLEYAFKKSMEAAIRAIVTAYECDELLDVDEKNKKLVVREAKKEEIRQQLEAKFLHVLEDNFYDTMDEVFVKISLAAWDPDFPENYIQARMQAVEADQKAKAAEALKRANIIEAQGIGEATVIMAKNDAKSIKLKGDAENAVLEEKGRILKENPDITPNVAANKPPQQLVICGGGNSSGNSGITPIIDVLRGLYPHSTETESASTTPTPTTPAPTTPTPPTP